MRRKFVCVSIWIRLLIGRIDVELNAPILTLEMSMPKSIGQWERKMRDVYKYLPCWKSSEAMIAANSEISRADK